MRAILFLVFIACSLLAENNNQNKIMMCLYKNQDAKKILEENGLNKKENIQNLLYAEKHKEEYYLKALVLDYLYGANNIDAFYKKAFEKSGKTEKTDIALFYTLYLQKKGSFDEATKFLRDFSVYAPTKLAIPKKIAYMYYVYGLPMDINIKSYFKVNHIEEYFIKGEISDCTSGN